MKSRNDRIAAVTRPVAMGLLAAFALACGLLSPPNALAIGHERTQYVVLTVHSAPMLRLGSRGPAVRELQGSLARLTFLPYSGVDGVFGMQTWHAVLAFQGWSGLSGDGIVGSRTRSALSHARAPTPWSRATGFEIHVPQQVLLLLRDGRVQRSIHVSTGAGGSTPLGHFHVYRRELLSWSVPFHAWMPLAQYFSGGYAIHQFASVPAYPASHGCVRVPDVEARTVWQSGAVGMRVWTERERAQ